MLAGITRGASEFPAVELIAGSYKLLKPSCSTVRSADRSCRPHSRKAANGSVLCLAPEWAGGWLSFPTQRTPQGWAGGGDGGAFSPLLSRKRALRARSAASLGVPWRVPENFPVHRGPTSARNHPRGAQRARLRPHVFGRVHAHVVGDTIGLCPRAGLRAPPVEGGGPVC